MIAQSSQLTISQSLKLTIDLLALDTRRPTLPRDRRAPFRSSWSGAVQRDSNLARPAADCSSGAFKFSVATASESSQFQFSRWATTPLHHFDTSSLRHFAPCTPNQPTTLKFRAPLSSDLQPRTRSGAAAQRYYSVQLYMYCRLCGSSTQIRSDTIFPTGIRAT